MSRSARHRTLTALRAFDLLAALNDTHTSEGYRIARARDALSEHIKAALTKRPRRKRASRPLVKP